jgi:probable F420-dependent oxidoreductase
LTSPTIPPRPRLGVVLPTMHLGSDVAVIKHFAQSVEAMGVDHLLCYDHVLGADPVVHAPWNGPYDIDVEFHEPLVLFGYLAGITTLDLATFVLVLPQRQTALVAKQAAEVALLAGGQRLRLGVGIGWNSVEYDALGQPLAGRGDRLEDQIAAMRALWGQRSVDLVIGSERIHAAGIAPRPSRQIPVWLGARSERALARVGRIADGWMPYTVPGHGFEEQLAIVHKSAVDADRDPATLGIQGAIALRPGMISDVARRWHRWCDGGATHVALNTIKSGLTDPGEHLELLAEAVAQLESTAFR